MVAGCERVKLAPCDGYGTDPDDIRLGSFTEDQWLCECRLVFNSVRGEVGRQRIKYHEACQMKRRTLKRLRPGQLPEHHHNVYVVLLEPAVGKIRKVRSENPKRNSKKPCLYVGMTGLTPEERFTNHKAGTKAAAGVKRYGLCLLPELYEHLNPMPYEAAAQMEQDLAEDLRRAGYTVTGGH